MNIRTLNWQIWLGFLISVFALMSYPLIFAEWPITRDFPWVNLLLFGIAAALVFVGIRRAFQRGRKMLSKIGAPILGVLSLIVFGLFILTVFIAARWIPASGGAPEIGQKAPEFNLSDTNGDRVSLSELLQTPISPGSAAPKGVVLIFYRGYW